jgi:hypothetical protein
MKSLLVPRELFYQTGAVHPIGVHTIFILLLFPFAPFDTEDVANAR